LVFIVVTYNPITTKPSAIPALTLVFVFMENTSQCLDDVHDAATLELGLDLHGAPLYIAIMMLPDLTRVFVRMATPPRHSGSRPT
jgi:hypothetical protein